MTEAADLLTAVHEARRQLSAALDEAALPVVLPQPARYITRGQAVRRYSNTPGVTPGAEWDVDRRRRDKSWAPGRAPVQVVASLDDVGTEDPGVYLRGIEIMYADDLHAMSVHEARSLALALLAACDMAGSEIIAKRCAGDGDAKGRPSLPRNT